MAAQLKIISFNTNGMGNYHKRKDVFDFLRGKNAHIVMLQETHLKTEDENLVRSMWGSECIINGITSNSNGVGIFFNSNFQYKIHRLSRDIEGKYIILDIEMFNKRHTIINLYGPSDRDNPFFFDEIIEKIEDMGNESIIIGGDWNVIPDMNKDTHRYRGGNRPRARAKINEMLDFIKLKDVWRELHPNDKRFTWRRFNSAQQGRLDYFLVSENILQTTISSTIEQGYRSDHSIITLELDFAEHNQRPRTFWKFNNTLLKDNKYVEIVKKIISDVKKQYGALVYKREVIDNIDCNLLDLVINDALFFDTLLMEIRGKSIAYSSYKKKESEKIEKTLMEEIENLEKQLIINGNLELLEQKKGELQSIRKHKIDGMIMRSKTQWSLEGERNTKYFCNLEKRHYTDKTLSTLETNDGQVTNDPLKIKHEVQSFYENLYKSREHEMLNIDLSTMVTGPTLNQEESDSVEGFISVEEAGKALKKMKNGKSPGLDGYTAEFFKFFWKDLSGFVVRAINDGFRNGEMSITQRRGVITCIPKENKPKRFLKNWRPITLLNTVYKIASACIAERLKRLLPKIIGEEQKGFLEGRYIGENIRMLYDVLSHTETHNLPGIIMLIDFEKAFDSISWSFIKKTLDFFKFGPDIKRWIDIFYKDITACVAINGNYTSWFQIQRGVRQGDPLSPYLYLISAEILSLLIKQHRDIKGIKVAENVETLLSQFADDTSLFLDGSKKGFEACVQCLEKFTDISGLKMNFEKTQIVWIGSRKNSDVRYMRDKNFIWNPGIFKVLGINFSVNMEEIVTINYENKLQEIDTLLKVWSKRHLTPFGKITVIKTMALAKLVHLFINLPDPKVTFINRLNKMFNDFLWDGKRAKMAAEVACAECRQGGLNMVDVNSFLASLKISWLKRLDKASETSVFKRLTKSINNYLIKLVDNGAELSYTIMNDLNNKNYFWFDVIKHYRRAYVRCTAETADDFLSECIHFNMNITRGNKYLSLDSWIRQGATKVGDVIDNNGNYFNFVDFKDKYPGIITDHIEYLHVVNSIKSYQNKIDVTIDRNDKRNELPKFWQILLKGERREMYCHIKRTPKKPQALTKWETIYDEQIGWNKIFIKSTKTTTDPKLKWFQIRTLYRLIPTNRFLHLRKIRDSPSCTFGCREEETIMHLFYRCPKVQSFWSGILDWIKNKCTNCDNLILSEQLIILGYKKNVHTDKAIDLIITVGKWHLYKCKLQEREPCLEIFRMELKERYLIEKHIHLSRLNIDSFNHTWLQYKNLIE